MNLNLKKNLYSGKELALEVRSRNNEILFFVNKKKTPNEIFQFLFKSIVFGSNKVFVKKKN